MYLLLTLEEAGQRAYKTFYTLFATSLDSFKIKRFYLSPCKLFTTDIDPCPGYVALWKGVACPLSGVPAKFVLPLGSLGRSLLCSALFIFLYTVTSQGFSYARSAVGLGSGFGLLMSKPCLPFTTENNPQDNSVFSFNSGNRKGLIITLSLSYVPTTAFSPDVADMVGPHPTSSHPVSSLAPAVMRFPPQCLFSLLCPRALRGTEGAWSCPADVTCSVGQFSSLRGKPVGKEVDE